MNILINALSGIGDALMFSPSLKLLYEKLPNYHIDMMVMFKSVSEVYRNSPYLRNILYIDFLNQSKFKSFSQLSELKKNDYFVSINVYPSNRVEYNVVNRFIGAKKRLAHEYLNSGMFRCEFLNNITVKEQKDIHNVIQNINLIKKLVDVSDSEVGKMEIFLSEDDDNSAIFWLKKNGVDLKKPVIGFHCGSSTLKNHIHKRWAKEKYADLGKRLMKDYGAGILLFGSETDLNVEINGMLDNKAVLASTANYMDSMARLKQCSLFVSNDTAFLHSASAFSIPTTAIFGYTNYKELYPWKTESVVVRKDYDCSPCFFNSPKPASCIWKDEDMFKCIRNITVDEVYDACVKLLANSRSPM
jgi:heptosyltransferase II